MQKLRSCQIIYDDQGEAKYAHVWGFVRLTHCRLRTWGAGGVVEEEAGVEPIDEVRLRH